jgi:hypothetical protein
LHGRNWKQLFIIITAFKVFTIDNNIMNLEEKKNLVIQHLRGGKLKEKLPKLHIYLLKILAQSLENPKESQAEKSIETQAVDLFYQGNKPIEVAVELNLNSQKTSKLYKDYLKLEGIHKHVSCIKR